MGIPSLISQSDISSQIRQALAITEPELDTTIGTTVRKIIDATSEVVAEAYLDSYLVSYQYDIDAKSGSDLDDFVANFGFARIPAKRATGVVTFSRAVAGVDNILIQIGSQVATSTAPAIVFSTVTPAILPAGETSVDIPVQAMIGGLSGNVGASAINRRVTPMTNITNITNSLSASNGMDAEGDSALRTRFKTTVFRSLAGTEQMFLAVALNNPAVTQANVIGSTKHHREQIALVSTNAISGVQNPVYIYDNPVFGVSVDGGQILTEGIHYTFTIAGTPPVATVHSIDAVNCPDGVYDLLFDYVPKASRNDPVNGITNKIDVYVNGQNPIEAIEQILFSDAVTFNTTPGSAMNRTNFARKSGALPTAGNLFIKFTFTPVIDAEASGNTIVIGGVTYTEGIDFFLVQDISSAGGTAYSNSGLEWISAGNGATHAVPTNGTAVQLDYLFNSVPRDVEIAMRNWRLVATDLRVHQAKHVNLNLFLAVILYPGVTLASVQTPLFNALASFISGVGFDGVVQVSDLLQVIHQVSGVDAARFLTSTDDAVNFGIQQVADDGTTVLTNFNNAGTPQRAIDVFINDDALPVLNNVTVSVRAQNTFGTV